MICFEVAKFFSSSVKQAGKMAAGTESPSSHFCYLSSTTCMMEMLHITNEWTMCKPMKITISCHKLFANKIWLTAAQLWAQDPSSLLSKLQFGVIVVAKFSFLLFRLLQCSVQNSRSFVFPKDFSSLSLDQTWRTDFERIGQCLSANIRHSALLRVYVFRAADILIATTPTVTRKNERFAS